MGVILRVRFFNQSSKVMSSLILGLLFCSSLLAQRTIVGTVSSEEGEALIGANVYVKGTSTGTVTDLDGKYSIDVSTDAKTLVFTYTGFTDTEAAIGASNILDVTLSEGLELSEVVVIGYAPIAREKVLGAVSSVKSEEIVENTPVSAFDAVQGRLAGVQILTNGGPGSGFDIKIRGVSTFSSGTSPLYVVDGQQLENIDNIDPNDIESLEVLKDGATAAIYGSRGANGVVLITTKSGSSKGIKVNVTANTSISDLIGGLPLSNSRQRIEYEDIRRTNTNNLTGVQRDSLSLLNRNSFDLLDLVTRTGIRNQANIAVSGGNQKAQVYWNIGLQDQKGIVVNSSYQRVNSRLKLNFQPIERLKLGTNLNISFENRLGLNEPQVFQHTVERIPYYPVYEPNGTFTPELFGRQNPVAEANLRTLRDRNFRSQFFSFAEFKLLPSLSIKSTLGANFRYRLNNRFEPVLTQNPRSPIPRGGENRDLLYDIQQENFLNYIQDFGKHSFSAFAGMQTQQFYIEEFDVQANFVSDAIETFNNIDPLSLAVGSGTGNEKHNLVSLFGGFNYDFNNKYLVGATIRRDGSSRFGDENKYGIFPSFTLGWRVSNESFIQEKLPFISNLLLRFSYGETGNERIGNYEFTSTYLPGFSYNGISGVAPARLGNSAISWESTTSTNIGFNLGILENRFNVVFELWKKQTDDLLASVPLPEESGFASIRQNVGSVENRGIDLALDATILKMQGFKWESSFNISFLENEVTRLAGGTPFQSGDYLIEEGEPIGNIFGFENLGVYQYDESNAYTPEGILLTPTFSGEGDFQNYTLNGQTYSGEVKQLKNAGRVLGGGDIIWEDLNNDFDITVADKQTIGNGLPKFFGGLTNSFSYKGLALSFLFDFNFGNDLWRRYDEARNDLNSGGETPGPDRIEGAWREQGDVTVYPSLFRVPQNRERPNSFFVTQGDFIKLRFIRLNYDLPKSLMKRINGIEKISFNASLNNLATWTNYIGYNPELGSRGNPLQPGVDNLRYPNSRSVIFGLRLQL